MERSQLKTLSDSYIADAPPNNITAANVRDLNDEVINSCASIADSNTFLFPNNFFNVVRFQNRFDTAATFSLSIMENVPIWDYNTYIELSGSFDTINFFSFNSTEPLSGSFRILKFNDPCVINNESSFGGNILTPNYQNIEVQSGDTCIVVYEYGSSRITFYSRFNGEQIFPLSKIWSWSDQVPTLTDDIANGFERYYRWISQESSGRLREWYLDDPIVNSAVWNPTSGTFGKWGDDTDLMIDDIFYASAFPLLNTNYRINYYRIGRLFYLIGWIEVEDPQRQSGGWKLAFHNNNQGIDFFGISNVDLKGFGVVTDSSKPLKNDEYSVEFSGINIAYNLSYISSGGANIRVYFNISTPYNSQNL